MSGELKAVWEETYQEIWSPLFGEWAVQKDIYIELYQELDKALTETIDASFSLHLNDALHLREVFDQTLRIAHLDIDRETAERHFVESNASEQIGAKDRRAKLEFALINLIKEQSRVSSCLDQALRELSDNPEKNAEAKKRALEFIVNDQGLSQAAFEAVKRKSIAGERALVKFLEAAYEIIYDYGDEEIANKYFNFLSEFIKKFNLRYDLRRPFTLCPTLSGLFSSLVHDLNTLTSKDNHLDKLMKDYQNAIRDIRTDASESRIKTCIQKQFNLLEAIGGCYPGIKNSDLMGICSQLSTWPHKGVKSALGSLYGFASDYPGIRHGGNSDNAIRPIDMRDLVAMSVLLAGFTPYLSHEISPDEVYRRD